MNIIDAACWDTCAEIARNGGFISSSTFSKYLKLMVLSGRFCSCPEWTYDSDVTDGMPDIKAFTLHELLKDERSRDASWKSGLAPTNLSFTIYFFAYCDHSEFIDSVLGSWRAFAHWNKRMLSCYWPVVSFLWLQACVPLHTQLNWTWFLKTLVMCRMPLLYN